MSPDLFIALATFAFVSSITPGPNNLMLMASGANFGLQRTIPHMLGISLGHGFMVFLIGLGLAELFERFPLVRTILFGVCTIYLLYLAWKIANAAAPGEGSADGRPFTFLQAAAFQWVNPKAIYMAITAQTYYAPPGEGAIGAVAVAVIFSLINLPSVGVWAWAGTKIRLILSTKRRLLIFNWTMALLLVFSLWPLLTG
ncbi:LysE family translocator [Aestuariibius sp. 2305UL40-4]|uniref:LysE family translocator n=1 Tax=Aestuariibius violaceus TaxID=3234132 RepID=UPI00345E6818